MKNYKFSVKPSIFSALCIMACALCLVTCGSKQSDPAEIAKKIDAKEQLSQADYAAIIDYCGAYAEKAQQYYDVINAQPSDSTAEAVKATSDLAALYAGHKYLDMFRAALYATDASQLDEENMKKVNKYSAFESFPLPGGVGKAMESPNVVGQIEDMPADSGNVISTGDGEAVDIQVNLNFP